MLDVPGHIAGHFHSPPRGIILHATRSGKAGRSEADEFGATLKFVASGAGGLGWHATVGPGLVALHLPAQRWGWNAREHSSEYLAIEFSQAQLGDPISDASIEAAAWWIEHVARPAWPDLPLNLVHHSELPAGIRDGKTDVAPRGSAEAESIRERLRRLL